MPDSDAVEIIRRKSWDKYVAAVAAANFQAAEFFFTLFCEIRNENLHQFLSFIEARR